MANNLLENGRNYAKYHDDDVSIKFQCAQSKQTSHRIVWHHLKIQLTPALVGHLKLPCTTRLLIMSVCVVLGWNINKLLLACHQPNPSIWDRGKPQSTYPLPPPTCEIDLQHLACAVHTPPAPWPLVDGSSSPHKSPQTEALIGEQCSIESQCLVDSLCIDGICACGTDAVSIYNPSSRLFYCQPKRMYFSLSLSYT